MADKSIQRKILNSEIHFPEGKEQYIHSIFFPGYQQMDSPPGVIRMVQVSLM